MRARDVLGDGNCYFRALSVCLYGHENGHSVLRQSIVRHISILADEGKSLPGVCMDINDKHVRQQLELLMKDNTWVGEDIIVAIASYLQRAVHIYNYTTQSGSSPQKYLPSDCSLIICASPITLAYYEPGHYKAAEPDNSVN